MASLPQSRGLRDRAKRGASKDGVALSIGTDFAWRNALNGAAPFPRLISVPFTAACLHLFASCRGKLDNLPSGQPACDRMGSRIRSLRASDFDWWSGSQFEIIEQLLSNPVLPKQK